MSTSSHLRDFAVKNVPSNDRRDPRDERSAELQRAHDALCDTHAAIHSILYAVEQLVREAPHMRDVAERAQRECMRVLVNAVQVEASLE